MSELNELNINGAAAGPVVLAALVIGGILKHAFPRFPNRFIPLVTWMLAAPTYIILTRDYSPAGVLVGILTAAVATGIHSGIKNTLGGEQAMGGTGLAKLLSLLVLLPMLFVGCATNPHARAIAAASITVEGGLAGWELYVEHREKQSKPVPIEQELRVVDVLTKYYLAEDLALAANAAYEQNKSNTNIVQTVGTAVQGLYEAKDNIFGLWKEFTQ